MGRERRREGIWVAMWSVEMMDDLRWCGFAGNTLARSG